nr:hypothetical protein GCM10020093_049780 [Planobispora longispora]
MYNVWRLGGALDAGALARALRDLAERHEILRTRYPDADGHPVAVAVPDGGPVIEYIDLLAGSGPGSRSPGSGPRRRPAGWSPSAPTPPSTSPRRPRSASP